MTRVPRSQRPITNPERYKWNALSNTTLGAFMALLNQSIVIISLPAIFRGIHLQPLAPGNFGYLLWLLLGYLVVTAVLVVALGRIGDQFGRVKMYNAGFLVFTVASIGLAFSPVTGPSGALVLIALRLVQGVGGAMLMANSTAILTDAFPVSQRGTALGFNIIAGTFASFLGLLVGGALAGIDWRLVFLVSVPFGLFGTVWAYATLRETGKRAPARLDIWGNLTFAAGLVLVMIGLTYGLQPYGSHTMGWTSPVVLGELIGLASRLPATLSRGLVAQGVSPSVAHHVANLPPVGTLFAAFLGYNPMRTLLGPQVLASVGTKHASILTGKTFFPSLISGPFHYGLVIAFSASAALCALAALASWWAGNCGEAHMFVEPGPRVGRIVTEEPDERLARLGS